MSLRRSLAPGIAAPRSSVSDVLTLRRVTSVPEAVKDRNFNSPVFVRATKFSYVSFNLPGSHSQNSRAIEIAGYRVIPQRNTDSSPRPRHPLLTTLREYSPICGGAG